MSSEVLTLQHDYDPLETILLRDSTRLALRLFRLRSAQLLADRLAFGRVCAKYGIDPNAADALEQVDFKISELGRPFDGTYDGMRDYVYLTG